VAEVTLVFMVVAAIAVLPVVALATPSYLHAVKGRDALTESIELAKAGEFSLASSKAETSSDEFAVAGDRVGRLGFLRYLPVLGGYVESAEAFLLTGERGALAVSDVLAVAAEMTATMGEAESLQRVIATADISAVFSDLRPESRQKLLSAFVVNIPKLRSASEQASLAISAFDSAPMSAFKRDLMPMRDRLDSVREVLVAALPAAETLPAAMGYPEARNYLIFFQNNTELRPTGGFLGVYGLIKVKDAEIVSVETDDIYAIDGPSMGLARPRPPEPLVRYLGVSKWFLRDANWSPDFPTSAARMLQFFREEARVAWGAAGVPEVHGIIVIDPELVKDIMKVVGPVAADDIVFTPDNFVDQLEYEVERGFAVDGLPTEERKGIVGRLTGNMMDRLGRASFDELSQLVQVFEENVREKHVMFWFTDPTLQSMAVRNGWAGEVKTVTDDYVQVIDANLASLKTDQAMRRTVHYKVSPDGDGFIGSVAIDYENLGSFTWKTTRYRTYTRVYLPAGSELIEVKGAMSDDKLKDPRRLPGEADSGEELGRAWFGAFISVEPQEKRTLEFRFKVAPDVARFAQAGEYRLYFAKQPGTLAHGLTLDLNFGKKLRNAEPPEDPSEWGDQHYKLTSDLREDRVFRVVY